jgi:hypothetical protein
MLAAAGATLAAFTIGKKSGAPVGPELIQEALTSRQILNVLDYVLRYSGEFEAPIDPRYANYQAVMAGYAKQIAESDDRIAFLKALLEQMKFDLKLDDKKKNDDKNSPTSGSSTTTAIKPGATSVKQSGRFVPNNTPYTLTLPGPPYTITVRPGNSLPNLNYLRGLALVRYLTHLGLPELRARELAAVITDWTDKDDFQTDGGAEAAYYLGLDPAYTPRNAPIRTWQELAYLKGVTPDLVRLLANNFTLHGEPSKVLADALSPAAIAALSGLPQDVVQAALDNRKIEMARDTGAKAQVTRLITDAEKALFSDWITFESTTDVMLIDIRGQRVSGRAVYDRNKKQLLDWATG